MLFSMVTSPRPTRAEVADVANAVLDGSDALMLSDETTVGAHPVAAAETMAAIIAATEDGSAGWAPHPRVAEDEVDGPEAVAMAACELAASVDAAVVVTLTTDGRTARWVAKYRPRRPILAVTPRAETYRRLALVRGVTPILLAGPRDDLVDAARAAAREHGWRGAEAVIVASDSIRRTAL
jgi:pyruvate kinase